MSGSRATEPIWHTFLLHPDIDLEAAKQAYETQGWQRDGNGSLCRINGVDYRLLGMKRLGRIIERNWRRDPKQPYDVPPGWETPLG
jgi:hypothetical protein